MQKQYRPGAKGALLDIYEQAIAGLQDLIREVPDETLTVITDPYTSDENCRSLQTILTHIVHAGYGYATSIHNLDGLNRTRPDKQFRTSIAEYLDDLDKVFRYTEEVFRDIRNEELEQYDNTLKILTRWGQSYDIEQLMEHAIVHILRHKRQIGKIIS
ncbi:DinB family protein [Flavihumibacter sp. R14]|nr:DinB family protein [Flavihumibacter soli]